MEDDGCYLGSCCDTAPYWVAGYYVALSTNAERALLRINIKNVLLLGFFVGIGPVNALQTEHVLQASLEQEFWVLGDEIVGFSERLSRLRMAQRAPYSREIISKETDRSLSESITHCLRGCCRALNGDGDYSAAFAALALLGKRAKRCEDIEELQVPNLLATGDIFFTIGFNPLLAELNQAFYLFTP